MLYFYCPINTGFTKCLMKQTPLLCSIAKDKIILVMIATKKFGAEIYISKVFMLKGVVKWWPIDTTDRIMLSNHPNPELLVKGRKQTYYFWEFLKIQNYLICIAFKVGKLLTVANIHYNFERVKHIKSLRTKYLPWAADNGNGLNNSGVKFVIGGHISIDVRLFEWDPFGAFVFWLFVLWLFVLWLSATLEPGGTSSSWMKWQRGPYGQNPVEWYVRQKSVL